MPVLLKTYFRRSPSPFRRNRYDSGGSPTRPASPPKQIATRPIRSGSQRRMSRERTHSISPTRVRAVHASPVRSQPLQIGKQSTPQIESRKLDDLDFSIIPTEAGDGPSNDPNATFEKPKRTISRTGTITKGKRPALDKTVDLNEKTAIITNPRDRSISKERPASKPRISGECP